MAASSHPSRHEREVERGATSHPRAGRLRCVGGRSGATTVMVESQPQRTAGAVPTPSVVVGVDATLLAARQLLNNPPPSGTSPSVAEQWRRNVDQLAVAAINTPLHERRRQPSAQYSRTPPAAHAPSAARALALEGGNLLLKMHATSRRSSAIIRGSCIAESSRWTIWCSGGSLAGRA
jgi:hypothetical protein